MIPVRDRWLLVLVCILTPYYYYLLVNTQCDVCPQIYDWMTSGAGPAPYRYRVLSAWLFQASGGYNRVTDVLIHTLLIVALILTLYLWLRLWTRWAIVPTLIMAFLMPLGFINYAFSPYTVLEVLFVLWALLLLQRWSPWPR